MRKRFEALREILSMNELRILPANLAYSFFLSLIPIISLIFYFSTTFHVPFNIIQKFLDTAFPQSVAELLAPVFNNNISLNSLIPIILGIFVATNGCNAIIITSNTVYKIDNAPFGRRMIKSLFLVILMTLLFTFIFIVPLLGRSIINLIGTITDYISINRRYINGLYFILQVPVSVIIMYFIIKIIYTIAPDDNIRGKYTTTGSKFTAIMWLIVTLIFSYYINNIAEYNAVYGNLANIVMLLFWVYILAYIFVIGLCLNKKYIDQDIEKTNRIKLEEIRNKVKESKYK